MATLTSSRWLLAAAPLVAASLAGCDPTPPNIDSDIALQSFTNCGQLEAYVEDAILETLVQNLYGWGRYVEVDAATDGDADSGSDGPSDYTTTNNQEEGVDELDIVKTNGTHIFTVQNGNLYIVKSWPIAETNLVAEVDIDGWAHGLFLQDDTIVVSSQVYNEEDGAAFESRSWSSTHLTFIDVSDPTSPEVTREIDIEGYLADGRLTNGQAYFVINTWMPIPQDFWDLLWNGDLDLPEFTWEDTEEELEQKREEARRILRPEVARLAQEHDLSAFLPLYADSAAGGDAEPTPLHQCTDVYRPAQTSQYSVLNIVQIDMDTGDLDATGLLSDGWQVYASRDNLYVAQSSWWWWWGWGDLDLETHIHQFELDERGPRYAGSGAVPGWTLDQFSFSEWDGHLRVATTDMDWWWGTTEDAVGANNVFVLENQGGVLERVGEVRGIAPGERIMTARMMGDKGYLVTFRQIDPLFTLDLSDHTDPKVVGELELPGFSSYLHPMGDDHLLAVGMAGDMDGNIQGLAVNVFDISDFANPTLAHQWVLESDDWSWSESLWDHHAFTYHRGVLSFPAYTWDWDGNDWVGFSGIIVLDASADGLEELGRIDHADLVAESECVYDWDCNEYDAWYAWMRRTVYIEDNLFSISNYGMKVNDLYDPSIEHARVVFEPAE